MSAKSKILAARYAQHKEVGDDIADVIERILELPGASDFVNKTIESNASTSCLAAYGEQLAKAGHVINAFELAQTYLWIWVLDTMSSLPLAKEGGPQ